MKGTSCDYVMRLGLHDEWISLTWLGGHTKSLMIVQGVSLSKGSCRYERMLIELDSCRGGGTGRVASRFPQL